MLIDLESRVVVTLDFSLQVCGPNIFAERFVTVFQLDSDQNQILFVAKLICKYIMHSAVLYLNYTPSIIGAVSVLLALNLSIRKPISDALGLDHIKSIEFTEEPLGAWKPKIEATTRIKAAALRELYIALAQSLDRDAFGGLLQ